MRIEAAENKAAAVQKQDEGAVVARAVVVVAQRNVTVSTRYSRVTGANADRVWITELMHHGFIVNALLRHGGRGR